MRMTRKCFCRLAPLALALLVIATAAQAQATNQLAVDINHAFSAGDKEMASGRYVIERSNTNPPILVMRAETGSSRVMLPVVTRLAQASMNASDPRLVFDQVGDQYFLSEVWMAGQDGFLVRAEKESHEHVVMHAPK